MILSVPYYRGPNRGGTDAQSGFRSGTAGRSAVMYHPMYLFISLVRRLVRVSVFGEYRWGPAHQSVPDEKWGGAISRFKPKRVTGLHWAYTHNGETQQT